MLKSSSSINISESSNFFSDAVEMDFNELVTKADIDVSFSALFESNLISVWEAENIFVWSEVLNLS